MFYYINAPLGTYEQRSLSQVLHFVINNAAGPKNAREIEGFLSCGNSLTYRVVFLTGPPDLQYQNEKQVAANQD